MLRLLDNVRDYVDVYHRRRISGVGPLLSRAGPIALGWSWGAESPPSSVDP